MSLATPDKIRTLQRKLYLKAKQEPAFRFYQLHDKVYRADILAHAYALCRANGGASGVDGVTFEQIESSGPEQWLARLGKELHDKSYKPEDRAAGDDPQARRGREAARHPDDSGPGGAGRRRAGAGAGLRGRLRGRGLRLPPAEERARRGEGGSPVAQGGLHG